MLQFNAMSGCAKLTQLAALIFYAFMSQRYWLRIILPRILLKLAEIFLVMLISPVLAKPTGRCPACIMSMFISTEITSTRATSYLSVMKAI